MIARAFAPAVAAMVAAAAFALGLAAPAVARPLDDLQQADAVVQTIAWRIARANAAFCTRVQPGIGLVLGDVVTFNDPAAARAAYGLSGDVSVAAVAEGGPAARAGLSANDTVLAVGDAAVAAMPVPRPGQWDRVLALQDRIDATARAQGRVRLTLAGARPVEIAAEPACAVRVLVDDTRGAARATRTDVRIGRRYYEQTLSDPEVLAAILAHEMAHAMLDHQSRLEESHRALAVVRATEREADRLSVWLLANAGYDPRAAVRLMETVVRRHQILIADPGHGGWKTRARVIAAELAAMAAAPDRNWAARFRRET